MLEYDQQNDLRQIKKKTLITENAWSEFPSWAFWRSSKRFLFQIVTRPLRFSIGRPSTGTTCETLKTFGKALCNPSRGGVSICKTSWGRSYLTSRVCVVSLCCLVRLTERTSETKWGSSTVPVYCLSILFPIQSYLPIIFDLPLMSLYHSSSAFKNICLQFPLNHFYDCAHETFRILSDSGWILNHLSSFQFGFMTRTIFSLTWTLFGK